MADATPAYTYKPLSAIGNCNIKCPTQFRITVVGDESETQFILKTDTNCILRGEIDPLVPINFTYKVELRSDPTSPVVCQPREWTPQSGPITVPEPSIFLLFAVGLLGLIIIKKWRYLKCTIQ